MAQEPKAKETVTLTLPPSIMKQARELAELKEMPFNSYVSEVLWVDVVSHRVKLLEEALDK